MLEILRESVIDTLKMLPVLTVMYILVELVETRWQDVFLRWLNGRRRTAPIVGALLGSIPQCGFTVISAGLFRKRAITMGTLVAVFLATSDEAVPILAANPRMLVPMVEILLLKIVIAVASAYLIDLFYKRGARPGIEVASPGDAHDGHEGEHCACGCCDHSPNKVVVVIKHILKTALFILIVTFIFGWAVSALGEEGIRRLFLTESPLQPVIAALFGLIPNCAVSVAITQLYVSGALSFGSVIAGLSTAGGVGLIVLFRENRNLKENLHFLAMLIGISSVVGVLLHLL